MAEHDINTRYFEILSELFLGSKKEAAALNKYARVRHTQHEILLLGRGFSLNEISSSLKRYFERRFLPEGVTIKTATTKQMKEAQTRLYYAVNEGCYNRCFRLVNELNSVLNEAKLTTIDSIERFLNYFTFDYKIVKDEFGRIKYEPYHSEPVLIFFDEWHRKSFASEIRNLKRERLMLSFDEIYEIIKIKRRGRRGGPDTQEYFALIDQLFFGPGSAVENFIMMRRALFAAQSFRSGISRSSISSSSIKYFEKHFLPLGVTMKKATREQIDEGCAQLQFAMDSDGRERCYYLMERLDDILIKNGLRLIGRDTKGFIQSYSLESDFLRKAFVRELRNLKRENLMLSVLYVYDILGIKNRRCSEET
ncbi:hypothetical protein IKG29_01565 [Candidatus Saccharibacteria bacterium]|nr:hypothetical protein [Candidatus Saccharibacteria bacterium]